MILEAVALLVYDHIYRIHRVHVAATGLLVFGYDYFGIIHLSECIIIVIVMVMIMILGLPPMTVLMP